MPELEKALGDYAVDEYYGKAYELVLSGKARDAMDLEKKSPRCASAMTNTLSARASSWPAASSKREPDSSR